MIDQYDKRYVFVHVFFAYFCSRVADSFITVVCDTDFAIIYVCSYSLYICSLEQQEIGVVHRNIDVAHRNICVCLHLQMCGTSLQ
jgi:hypothetical protein